ncbi:hypothetical protein BX666DRAFT_1840489, partial [Dichotomocladium elegans]
RKKRAKSYHCAKERVKHYDKFSIRPNMTGIMVTCTRSKEQRAAKEVIDMFEEYATSMYPNAASDDDDDEDDIEASIQKEVTELKKGKKKKFVNISTNTDCLLFIETRNPIEPVPFVHHILTDLKETRQKKTRFVSRLLPVQTTCHANLPAIEQAAKLVLAPTFHQANDDGSRTHKTYAVVARIRNCDKMERMSVIETIASVVGKDHTVDLTNPEVTIIAEIMQVVQN